MRMRKKREKEKYQKKRYGPQVKLQCNNTATDLLVPYTHIVYRRCIICKRKLARNCRTHSKVQLTDINLVCDYKVGY